MNSPTPSHGSSRVVIPRRHFLAASLTATAAGSLPRIARAARPTAASPAPCRNVIFMVADGMSVGTLTLADTWSRRKLGRPSHWVSLWSRQGVRRSSASTYSADSLVTDSAAGACAWGIGSKVNNESINITPDGRPHTPILVQAKENGKAVGVVTTTRITHATPAGFYATIAKRDMEGPIGVQLVERSLDVAFGGGDRYFGHGLLGTRKDLTVARSRQDLKGIADNVPAGPALGLFARDHVPYVLDATPEQPTLAEMTGAALSLLSKKPNGFVLQIEGGRVDHAAHNSDAGSLLAEQLAFDDAVGVVSEFALARDDTLVVMTSDHGNANPGLTFYGPGANEKLDRLAKVRHSFDSIFEKFGKDTTTKRLAEVIEDSTSVEPKPADLELLARRLEGQAVACGSLWNTPTMLLGAILSDSLGVAFMSPNHTSDFVEVTAYGPGSERLPGMVENTDLWGLMVNAMKLAPAKPIA